MRIQWQSLLPPWRHKITKLITVLRELPGGDGTRDAVYLLLDDTKQWAVSDLEMQIHRAESKSTLEQCRCELLDALYPETKNLMIRHAISLLERQRW
jgi:hypothetical protein